MITNYHVVLDCKNLIVSYPTIHGNQVEPDDHTARVLKVLKRADLALLGVNDARQDRNPLDVDFECPAFRSGIQTACGDGQSYDLFGYDRALGKPDSWDITTGCCFRKTLNDMLNETEKNDLRSIGFPALDLTAIEFTRPILPGQSGSPVVDQRGHVVGIADGGFGVGSVDYKSWAIPSMEIRELWVSTERPSSSDAVALAREFRADTPSTLTQPARAYLNAVRYSLPTFVNNNDHVFVAAAQNGSVAAGFASFISSTQASASYDAGTRTFDVTKPGADIKISVGNATVTIDGETHPLDDPPFQFGQQVFIPLRIVEEAMGAYAFWDAARSQLVAYYLTQKSQRWSFHSLSGTGIFMLTHDEDGHWALAFPNGSRNQISEQDVSTELVNGNLGYVVSNLHVTSGRTMQLFVPLKFSVGDDPNWILSRWNAHQSWSRYRQIIQW